MSTEYTGHFSIESIINLLNQFSLADFEGLARTNCGEISIWIRFLEEQFTTHIQDLKVLSTGNTTRTQLLSSTDNVEFIIKGIIDESSLRKQSEFINYWISRSILCQMTIILLLNQLVIRCGHFKAHWQKYVEKDTSDVLDERYLFRIIYESYGEIYSLCQNIGLAIQDYLVLHQKIKSNIGVKEEDFKVPYVQDPEDDVSGRISQINQEAKKCLLANPTTSTLGLSAVRIVFESYIILKIEDKIRQHIRIKNGTNVIDVRFSPTLKRAEIFKMIFELFPNQKEYEALNNIYSISSRTIHRAIPQPTYISWASLSFIMEKLERMIGSLLPADSKLADLTARLISEKKLCVFSCSVQMPT